MANAAQPCPPTWDVAVVGAGPVGIAAAVACQQRGLRVVLIDQGCLCAALHRYPRHMTFFSTAANIEIGGHPFACLNPKPTRDEALEYYRGVAAAAKLTTRLYHRVTAIADHTSDRQSGYQVVTDRDPISARRVILATGFFHQPVALGIPGEDGANVSHFFDDGHRYFDQDLVIVGGANSAVIAALECWRRGARVRLVHRGPGIASNVKYWLKPDIENRIAEGSITAEFTTTLTAIGAGHATIRSAAGERQIPADFCLLLTGYRADTSWLDQLGVTRNQHDAPLVDPATFACQARPGISVIGCALCGEHTGDIFIENGRDHATAVADAIAAELR